MFNIAKYAIPAVMAWILFASGAAQSYEFLRSENSDVVQGNAALTEERFADAVESYDSAARSLPSSGAVHLNRALALQRSGDDQLDQAMQALTLATEGDTTEHIRARAQFNLGNAFFKKEDYKAAIEHFKKSLMLEPGQPEAAWNLELAKQKKKEQDEEQEKQDQDKDQQDQDQDQQDQDKDQEDQDQDQQDQDQDQQDQDQDQQDQDQDQQKDQDQKDQEQKDQEKEQQDEAQQPPKTRQDVEQLLDALEDDQDDLHKNMARQRGAVFADPQKDW